MVPHVELKSHMLIVHRKSRRLYKGLSIIAITLVTSGVVITIVAEAVIRWCHTVVRFIFSLSLLACPHFSCRSKFSGKKRKKLKQHREQQ